MNTYPRCPTLLPISTIHSLVIIIIVIYNQRRAQRAMDRIVRGEGREAESVIHLSKRPKRDRRAPERLNITSTKSKTYLE